MKTIYQLHQHGWNKQILVGILIEFVLCYFKVQVLKATVGLVISQTFFPKY